MGQLLRIAGQFHGWGANIRRIKSDQQSIKLLRKHTAGQVFWKPEKKPSMTNVEVSYSQAISWGF